MLHPPSAGRLATSATLHCLAGCGLGEIAGDALGTGLNLSNSLTVGLGLVFGLVGGFALGIVPYRRRGRPFGEAARAVLITEGISIAVMEAAEAGVEVFVPGLMPRRSPRRSTGSAWLARWLQGFSQRGP